MQTLLQLLPPTIESSTKISGVTWRIPAVSIKDEPTFEYRGALVDVCRHFLSVDEVKKHIDLLSMFKINRMHWHLTEDQGWRIEIKKYPRLTTVGSKRIEGDGSVYGGFYTQEQVRDIVKYASDRFVTVIPEIELPGHAMGAIASYPELTCFPHRRVYEVRNLWGIEQDVYCPGKETTFKFIQDVLDEVLPLFPSEYVHIGGDECPKIRWKECPDCQRRIKEEGLKNEEELQSYTIRRAQRMLAKHGKKLIGWDEILEGGLAPSATVMSWRGEDGGIKAANMGHDVIMTPGSGGLYIDHYQGDSKIEPVAICCYASLEKVYSYNPIPAAIAPDKRHHIKGAQANLWAEYLYTTDIMQYRAFPRVIALAEATWTPQDRKDYKSFERRLNGAYIRLDQHKVNYHIPLPEQPLPGSKASASLNFVAFTDTTSLTLQTSRPITIVYTTDGSEPTAESGRYTAPIKVSESHVVGGQDHQINAVEDVLRSDLAQEPARRGHLRFGSDPPQTFGEHRDFRSSDIRPGVDATGHVRQRHLVGIHQHEVSYTRAREVLGDAGSDGTAPGDEDATLPHGTDELHHPVEGSALLPGFGSWFRDSAAFLVHLPHPGCNLFPPPGHRHRRDSPVVQAHQDRRDIENVRTHKPGIISFRDGDDDFLGPIDDQHRHEPVESLRPHIGDGDRPRNGHPGILKDPGNRHDHRSGAQAFGFPLDATYHVHRHPVSARDRDVRGAGIAFGDHADHQLFDVRVELQGLGHGDPVLFRRVAHPGGVGVHGTDEPAVTVRLHLADRIRDLARDVPESGPVSSEVVLDEDVGDPVEADQGAAPLRVEGSEPTANLVDENIRHTNLWHVSHVLFPSAHSLSLPFTR